VEGAVDGKVELGRLQREAARGGSNSGEGRPGAGSDQVGELGEKVRKRVAEGIWTGWRGGGEFRRGEAAAARCREEEEKAKQLVREGLIGFCSSARFVEKRERERGGDGHGRTQDGGRRSGGRRVLGEAVARARQDSKAQLERRARSG
jgi:hypothetical protein